jgi:succinoglycan biosynthesis transport protein ExoP
MNILHNRIENNMELESGGQKPYLPSPVTTWAIPQPIQPVGDSFGVGELMAGLWQKKAVIAGAAGAGLLVGLLVSLVTTPSYRARASLQLEGFNNDLLHEVSPVSPSLPNASPENYLQNEVKLLESETMARRVANKMQIDIPDAQQTAIRVQIQNWFFFLWPARRVMTPDERRVKRVQKALSVRTSLQSQVIELFYEAPDPNLAARGANAAAAEFVNLNRETRWQVAQDTTEWLNRQAESLKASLESSNRELQDFARESGLVFAGKQSTLAEERMKQVQDALTKAEAERAAKQARYEAAKSNPNELMSDALEPAPIRQAQTDLQNLRRELAELLIVYTPSNYRVQRVQAQIAETEKSIENERKQALGRMATEYLAAAGLEKALSQAETDQLKTVEQQMEKERRYDVRKSEIEATQRLYESLLEKVKEAGAQSSLRTTNVRIIDPASVPSIPFRPNPPLNMAIGLAIGALGGIAVALVKAGSDNKVKRPGELLPHVPSLGVIPSAQLTRAMTHGDSRIIRFKRLSSSEVVSATRDEDGSLWNESFRSVLTSILFSQNLRRSSGSSRETGRILVVSSIDVMEGKTVVVSNLGFAAAERKQRVLLIDADLRRPRLHERIILPNTRGLSDILPRCNGAAFNSMPVEEMVLPTPTPNLWVLPSGPVDSGSAGLLYSYSSNLGTILSRFRKEFDLILIDTPPMMLYAEGRILGRMSDGLVMVVRANTKSREELNRAVVQFAQDRIPLIGTVLNDWRPGPHEIRSYRRYQTHYSPRVA